MKIGMNLTETAKFLGVHRNTIKKWISEGKLVPRKNYAGTRYFLKKDLIQEESCLMSILERIERKIDEIANHL